MSIPLDDTERPPASEIQAPMQTFTVEPPVVPDYKAGYWNQLVGWHVEWSKDYGFLCVVLKSDARNTEFTRRGIIQCSRSGAYRPHRAPDPAKPAAGIRPHASRKTGCPFRIHYCYNTTTGLYVLTASQNSKHNGDNYTHNHPPDDIACFYQYRRLTGDMLQFALDLVSSMSPGSILGCLQAKYGIVCLVTYDDVRNLQQRVWRAERRGMRATEAMLLVLRSVNMSSRYWLHPQTAELLGVIITDPLAITLAQTFGHVLQMDCTYKTNKYNMPMFHVTSHTSTGQTFTVAVCFLKQETIADYTRALQELKNFIPDLPTKAVVTDSEAALSAALKAVCPEWKHILCRWHVGQNILTEFKRRMTVQQWNLVMKHWRDILDSPSEIELQARLERFALSHSDKPYGRKLVAYINHRLRPGMREKLVSCYIDGFAHYGQTSSSRAEGGHSQLKRQLNTCRGDLFLVVKIIRSGMYAQQSRILHKLKMERFSPPVERSQSYLGEVRSLARRTHLTEVVNLGVWISVLQVMREVSRDCLDLLEQHYNTACKWVNDLDHGRVDMVDECQCRIRTTHDLPCYHYLLDNHYVEDRKAIALSEIGSHWYLHKADDLQKQAQEISETASVKRVQPPAYPEPSASQVKRTAKRTAADASLANALERRKRSRVPVPGIFASANDAQLARPTAAPESTAVSNSHAEPTSFEEPREASHSPPRRIGSPSLPSLPLHESTPPALSPVAVPSDRHHMCSDSDRVGNGSIRSVQVDLPEFLRNLPAGPGRTSGLSPERSIRPDVLAKMNASLELEVRDIRRLRGMQGLEPEVGLNG